MYEYVCVCVEIVCWRGTDLVSFHKYFSSSQAVPGILVDARDSVEQEDTDAVLEELTVSWCNSAQHG